LQILIVFLYKKDCEDALANVIELGVIENENTRRLLANKILAYGSDIPYTLLLKQLELGGVDYYVMKNNTKDINFDNAIFELDTLGIKYRIVEKKLSLAQNLSENEENILLSPLKKPKTQYLSATSSLPKPKIENTAKLIDEKKPIRKKNTTAGTIFILLCFAIAVFLMFYLSRLRSEGNFSTQSSQQRPSSPQTQTEAQYDQALSDADKACVEGAVDMEKMYRFAISFNKHNLKAWFGLLDCFEKKGDGRRMIEIREEMRELFGENIFTIARAVSLYGILENFSSQGKTGRLSYLRNENTSEAERELFAIAQVIANLKDFDKAIIFAKNPDGRGFMISLAFSELPETFEEFKQKILVNKLGH
jgi:hypothetical protein